MAGEHVDPGTARFLGWLVGLSILGWVLVRISGGYALFTTALMWSPGVAALIVAAHSRSLGGLGWRWPATSQLFLGFAIPVLYSGLAYTTLWMTNLVPFDPAPTAQLAERWASPRSPSRWPPSLPRPSWEPSAWPTICFPPSAASKSSVISAAMTSGWAGWLASC